jgi:trigger factor
VTELAEKNKAQGGDGSTLKAVLDKKGEVIPFEVLEEEKMPGSRVRFKLQLTEEAIAGRLEETLTEFVRNVRMPGFRPGKAPKTLVRRQYEPAAREETIKRMVGRLTELFTEQRNYEALSNPYLLEWKSSREEGTVVELAIEVHPEINLNDETLADLKAEVHRVAINDEYVDLALEELRAKNATFEPTEEAYQPQDGLLFNCTVTNPAGEVIAERSAENYYSTNIEQEMPEAVAAALVGAKKGDTVTLDVTEQVDGADPGVLEAVHYVVEVLEVKRRTLPALDDEFAKDVNEAYQTLDDLRKATLENAAAREESRQREEILGAILSTLRERLEFDLPRALVEDNTQRSVMDTEKRLNSFGISLRQMDEAIVRSYASKMRELAKVNVKNALIIRAINKHLGITPTEDQINSALEDIAKRSGRKALAVRAQLEAKKQWSGFIEDLTIKLTNDALIAKAAVSYKDVTAKEFAELKQKAQAEQAAALVQAR